MSQPQSLLGKMNEGVSKRWRRIGTTVRLLGAVVVLVFLWPLLFELLPQVVPAAEATEVDGLDAAIRSLAGLNASQKVYLTLAVSVPLLFFVFGAGPLSQCGTMAYEPPED